MKEKTLLLNATYEPLRVISWERAISLYYLGKVEIVDTYERNILTQKVSMKIPAVVRVKRFVAFQRAYRHVKFSRQNVFTRDRYTCQYCGETQKGEHLTFDHVIPQCQGGETTFNNIVTAINASTTRGEICWRQASSRTNGSHLLKAGGASIGWRRHATMLDTTRSDTISSLLLLIYLPRFFYELKFIVDIDRNINKCHTGVAEADTPAAHGLLVLLP